MYTSELNTTSPALYIFALLVRVSSCVKEITASDPIVLVYSIETQLSEFNVFSLIFNMVALLLSVDAVLLFKI